MRAVGQSFSQTMSLPWELRLVRLNDGQYQLRASIPEEVASRIEPSGRDAAGLPGMSFSNNIFEMPDAYGNCYVLQGSFDISECETFRLEVGTSIFTIQPRAGRYMVGVSAAGRRKSMTPSSRTGAKLWSLRFSWTNTASRYW